MFKEKILHPSALLRDTYQKILALFFSKSSFLYLHVYYFSLYETMTLLPKYLVTNFSYRSSLLLNIFHKTYFKNPSKMFYLEEPGGP